MIVITDYGVYWNAKASKGVANSGQLFDCTVVGEIAAEQTKFGPGRAKFYLFHHLVEPRPARGFEIMKIVDRDEGKFLRRRGIRFAEQTPGPKTQPQKPGTTQPKHFPTRDRPAHGLAGRYSMIGR